VKKSKEAEKGMSERTLFSLFSPLPPPPEGGPTFAKYPKCFLTLNFLGSGLTLPILGYLAFYFTVPLSLHLSWPAHVT